ncbi:MAG: ATP-binding protein [Candidatus Bipolaricaulota bacterium]|nr:ATP-binding protein [Candidatus Bipolaricaulota bacterium]MDW8126317.1 ATP-binding protein [Candidatus Bipolaricaulota bacterium]
MSFRWKLVGALTLVAILAAVGTYLLTAKALGERFAAYRLQEREAAGQQLARLLGQFWEARGTWAGVDQLFRTRVDVFLLRQGRVVSVSGFMAQYLLLDREGNVVGCAEQSLLGRCTEDDPELRERARRYGIPVFAGGRQVGTLVPIDPAILTPLEQDFLASVRRAALVGGAVAFAVALLLGTLLATQLSLPLQRLIHATERIAKGDLAHRVVLRTRDEIGRLAHAFNRMAEALQNSEAVRKQFLADVAHELRTPLSVIRGNLEAILDGAFPLTPESLVPVYEETLHLGELVEDLRTLTLADTGHLPLEKERVELGELVAGVVEAVRPVAKEEGVEVALQRDPELWVFADPRRIRQVLGNLLSNALRYSPPGSVITVAAQKVGNEVWVSVQDQGPGIPEEDLPHIFERFYKVDKSRSEGGTGLGLAIAKELVQAHDGRIWAENRNGARFTFALPAL